MKTKSMNERKISDPKNKPTGPHMAILVWDTVNVDTGWSREEGGGPENRTIVEYYVFSVDEKKDWEDVLRALQFEGKKIFMGIRVAAVAQLTVSVAIE